MQPPEYHLEHFWDARFTKEGHFEWLGDGQHTVLPIIDNFVKQRSEEDLGCHSPFPRVLHIGAGTSTLSDHIMDILRKKYGNVGDEAVVNTDFSKNAVDRGVASEIAKGSRGIQWKRADLLVWEDVWSIMDTSKGPFTIVVDKSTSDAISCADDMMFQGQGSPSRILPAKRVTPKTFPLIKTFLSQHPHVVLSLQSTELLALHLAAIVQPNGIWVALSYSQNRFRFLGEKARSETVSTDMCPSLYWKVEKVQGVDAPSGQMREGVHSPLIQHFVYVLRRTDVEIDLTP